MIIQFPVEVRSIKSTVDRSILVQLCTQEMSNDDCAVLFALRETLAWCVLASQEIKPEEVKPEIVGRKEGKTASQRRRDKMAVYYYNHLGGSKEKWQDWYDNEQEKSGDAYLAMMNE